ncbi:hypothetical protein [Dyella telluris]|uniref:Uncharacterized protein n=1 Tax=Dyella telluris TaxID=2763498 RepID=A0A7G8Q107_9GAMM|nr:hypothetical protein [Dyella telluris]QNK00465.1 hypothetical protein H8F01_15340 [Dyella telluris]
MATATDHPVWKHSNPLFRRIAIELGRDPRLIEALPRLATTDPVPAVRQAALQRCADVAVAQRVAHDDEDPPLRAQARALYFSLMAGTHTQTPPAQERLRLLSASTDPALCLHVAIRSPDAAMRGAALQALQRRQSAMPGNTRDEVTRADENPLFNRTRSRAMLRRAIVVVACEVARALSTQRIVDAWKWADTMERFVADWPVRWPLPCSAVRAANLMQQTFRATDTAALPTARPRTDLQFDAPQVNLSRFAVTA